MKNEDFLYAAFFYSSIAASLIDKCYVIDKYKGRYGAVVGFSALWFLCGFEIVHPLVNILVNTVIICSTRKRWSRIFAFTFTCSYLFYFRYFCTASSITNVFMMSTTLKMISVAIDSSEEDNASVHKETRYNSEYYPTPEHIICYALHYIGLIGVPYYTYKTYCDYLFLPFKHHPGEWQYNTMICVIDSHLIMLGRYSINHLYPFSYVSTDEFYNESNILFRILYIYPIGIDFLLRISNAFVLTKASCFISGIGAYPDFTKPKCGHGPTENLQRMFMIPRESVYQFRYSYKAVQNANVRKLHTSIQFKEAIKYWNQTIQFWLYKYVYKMVPYNMLRKPATMLFSSFWHGLQIGYFQSLFFASLILFIEERWEIILKGRVQSSFQQYLRIILKLHIFYSLAFIFVSQEWSLIVRYQTSVYWNYIVLLLLLLFGSMLFTKRRIQKGTC